MDAQDDEIRRREAAEETGRKLDEFDAELSGTLSGYRGKHLPEDYASKPESRERRAAKAKAQLSRLEALLINDPAYAALYTDTFDMLRDAETATEAALAAAQNALAEAEQDLADTLDSASTLPDGKRVFRDPETGNVYDENGTLIEGDDLDAIVWRDDAPTWQDYKGKRQTVTDTQDRVDDLRRYQTVVLGHARDRLEDEDNPPTPDELREIQKQIEDEAPSSLAKPSPDSELQPSPHSFASGQLPKV